MSEYLRFSFQGRSTSGKTEVYAVRAVRSGALLGTIRWFGRWRQYAFWPEPETIFNQECLHSIADFVADLTRRHRGS